MKPAIDRLEHWLEVLVAAEEKSVAVDQARLAIAEVRDELEARTRRSQELYDQGATWRQYVELCGHSAVCEVSLWQAGNRRWFAQIKLTSGDELEPRSGETPEEAVRNAVEAVETRGEDG